MRSKILSFFGLFLAFSITNGVDSTKPDEFEKLHALIKPNAGEDKFMQIPWMIDLWEARKKAASEDRPILLWEMDGHPLGCV